MECPTCGAEIEGRPSLCPLCGSELPVEREVNRCPACGAKVAEGAETCDMCGAVLVERRGTSYLLVAIESLLVVLAVVVLLGSIWLLRPREVQPTAVALPTPIPTSTPTPTRPPKTPTPTVTSTPTITPTPTPPFITHIIQAGDTLYYLAIKYGTTVDAIVAASGLSGPEELLQIGRELRIPLGPEALPPQLTSTATSVPTTASMATSVPPIASTATSSPTIAPTSPPPFVTHTVRAGDTLLGIAAEYDTTVEAIVAANDLSGPEELLQIGQELRIPLRPEAPTSQPTAAASPTVTSTSPPSFTTHTVRAGDTLLGIAAEYDTTVEAIVAANGLSGPEELLQIGQELRIPLQSRAVTPGSTVTSPPVTAVITHTVEEGDTLYFLAIKYGTTVETIMELNGMTDAKALLQVGQVLIISAETPVPTPTPTSTRTSVSPTINPSTSTPTPTTTSTPTITPTPTETPWPTPRPTATTSFPYPAPILLGPPADSLLEGETPILLNWASVGLLAKDEWYVVRVRYACQGETEEVEEWVKATSWRLPPSLCSTSDEAFQLYQWDVTVMRRAEAGKGVAISPRSETCRFRSTP